MKKIFVHNLKSGMSFDKPVYLDQDNIFLQEYEPITITLLKKLKTWKIKELSTHGELIHLVETRHRDALIDAEEGIEIAAIHKNLKKMISTKNEFDLFFESNMKILAQAYKNIEAEKPFQISRVREISEQIVIWIKEHPMCFINLIHLAHKHDIIQHTLCTSFWGSLLAKSIGFSQPKIIEVAYAILLMNIGMMKVPDTILNREEKLSVEEKKIIEMHTVHGYDKLLNNIRLKNKISLVALQHHENFDGSGYPKKLRLYDIDDYARIASIADSFTAMLGAKPYQKALAPYLAMKDLLSSNLKRYDPKYIKAFCNAVSVYPIGSLVQLSDDSINMVVAPHQGKPMRPIVLTLRTRDNYKPVDPKILSLGRHHQLYIKNFLEAKKIKLYPIAELETIFATK